MLWRVRTTLADRPGTLAELARHCGEREVNILGLQIFPGIEGVTDELVLRAPDGWATADVAALVEGAGGREVSVRRCTEHALVDGPTRYVTALRQVMHGAEPVGRALARLLDARYDDPAAPAGEGSPLGPVEDVLVVVVGQRRVELRRAAAFTATEHARATAFAQAVAEMAERGLVEPGDPTPGDPAAGDPTAGDPAAGDPAAGAGEVEVRPATEADVAGLVAMHGRCSADTLYRMLGAPLAGLDARLARRLLLGGAGALVATTRGQVVGLASLGPVREGGCEAVLLVEDGRQRQGIGSRLLSGAVRLAGGAGAAEVVLRGPAQSPALVAMAFASGLRARVRLSGDELQVTLSTRGLAVAAPALPREVDARA